MHFLHSLLCLPFVTCIIFFLTLFLRSTHFFRPFSPKKVRLPPSPPRLPIIGNLHQLGNLPHRSLLALSKKYGTIMLLQLGQAQTLVVSSSELAQEVMKAQDHIFANRPSLTVPRVLLYQGKDIAFAPYSDYWRQVKKVGVLNLLSNKQVQSYRTLREKEVAYLMDKVSRLSSLGTINLTMILNTFAKDFISKVALGELLNTNRVGKLFEETSVLLGAFHWGDYIPWLAWMSKLNGLDARIRKNFEEVNEFLDSIVEKQASKRAEDNKNEGDAFVDVLLSIEKDANKSFPFDKLNIKAIIKDIFIAGIDTTYISMEWIMAELFRNSDIMMKLKEEIRGIVGSKPTITEEHLAKMDYLKAVIKETFRLHPPGPLLVLRESMEETEIQGYQIPKHTKVFVNVWAIGRDPTIWEAPGKFWPQRFMGSDIDFKGQDYQLIPFGAGRRICPGIQFVMVLIELAVANLVHKFEWKLPGNMNEGDMDMEEAPGLACRKKINLHVIASCAPSTTSVVMGNSSL